MTIKKLPSKAMHLTMPPGSVNIQFAEGEETPKFEMVAYSGKTIKNHWYWDDLAIDISGVKMAAKKIPILEEHRDSRKIGFAQGNLIKDNQIFISDKNFTFVDTEESLEFRKLSKQGFPYQASIYAKPTKIERISEGSSAQVNGFTLKGPATIWRECELKESSVCVFGYDSKTSSKTFSEKDLEEIEVEEFGTVLNDEDINNEREVNSKMDLNKLKEEHPDLIKQIQTEVKEELEGKFKEERESFSKENEALKNENEQLSSRVLDLEKKDAIRTEKEIADQASSIWSSKLSNSQIPQHLFNKVRQHVVHTKFVAEGIFDSKKFGEAVDAEIEDWVKMGVTDESVKGLSTTKEIDDKTTEQKKFAEENDSTVKNLLNFAGQSE